MRNVNIYYKARQKRRNILELQYFDSLIIDNLTLEMKDFKIQHCER